MNPNLANNAANIIVLIRVLLVFVVVLLLNTHNIACNISGLLLILIVALLDGVDGYVARKYSICSRIGGLLDTLGDRITENIFLMFFAYKMLIPIFVPLIFITRSFIADFIRYLSYQQGLSTFTVNNSMLGSIFVASKTSRVLYLVLKIAVFIICALIITLRLPLYQKSILHGLAFLGAIVLVIFNLLRFILLVYDSRIILKDTFSSFIQND